ncbi:MAG: 1-deoxy-D-xylulose-5-phosphate reductoisomerase, partial [Oscillospiraceae bacterium]|nr:1-deoxy-D-xylulose-5-phosphate reductoisomerase [Oscillospiraceae bacterium]
MKRCKVLAVLGSTGSIGTQALDVARSMGLRVGALAARRNVALLEAQAREFRPKLAVMMEEAAARDLRIRLADTGVKVLQGMEGFEEAASHRACDTLLNAIVGMVGLRPTLAAISSKKRLALANKETLAAAGELVTSSARKNGVEILPVDSEHSAIFQCLQGSPRKSLRKILLTASGGPFFGKTIDELRDVTPEQALRHPNWSMGAKITVDSSTLMNKGLEVIEAAWLFGLSPGQIEIVVHRESIIHSAVEFVDNSVIAQLGLPDMRIPIQYALSYPDRAPSSTKPLDLAEIGGLSFARPDTGTFRCLAVCIEALERGGLVPAA